MKCLDAVSNGSHPPGEHLMIWEKEKRIAVVDVFEWAEGDML